MVEVQGKLNNIMVDTDSAQMYQTIPGFLLQINCDRMVRHVQYIPRHLAMLSRLLGP